MGPHILVVDDDQVCAEAISLLLRSAAYQVSVAHHFNEAAPNPRSIAAARHADRRHSYARQRQRGRASAYGADAEPSHPDDLHDRL